jgi:hypothetical protein
MGVSDEIGDASVDCQSYVAFVTEVRHGVPAVWWSHKLGGLISYGSYIVGEYRRELARR